MTPFTWVRSRKVDRMEDDEREAIETVQNWLIRTYGREHDLTTSANSVGSVRTLLLVTTTTGHPELPVEVLEAWQDLIRSEQHHLDQSQRALYGQPNYARMAEQAAAEEDPSRRAEREAESW